MTTTEGKPTEATHGLRELIDHARRKTPSAEHFRCLLTDLEALLPALDAAIRGGQPRVLTGKRLEETIRAYCGRDMTEGIDWSSIAVRLNADAAPPHAIQASESELGNLKTAREVMCEFCDEGVPYAWTKGQLRHHRHGKSGYYYCPRIARQTSQDVAYRIFAEITVIPADAQAAKVIVLISQAVAQARVDEAEWWAAGNHDKCGPECSLGRRLSGLKRDLAAIAKETQYE